MLDTKLNAHGGFIPAAVALPNAIISQLVISSSLLIVRRDSNGIQTRSPALIIPVLLVHCLIRGILQS